MRARRPTRREEFEIAIICALPVEHNAVSLLFDERWDEDGDQYGRAPGDDNFYVTGRIGKYAVVLALLPQMGKASAAGAAAGMRSSYRGLHLALLVGICGGVPQAGSDDTGEIILGDVVISKTIIQYDFGRQYPHKFVRKNTADSNLSRPNKDVRNLLITLETDDGREWLEAKSARFLRELQDTAAKKMRRGKFTYPGIAEDNLFEAMYRHKHHTSAGCVCHLCHDECDPVCGEALNSSCADLGCDEGRLVNRKRLEKKGKQENGGLTDDREYLIHIGPVASGDLVMKSGHHRDRLAREEGVIAFEMEGAGIWEEVPCIVIKGVCDYADSHKNKKWQEFAAATAASTSKAILLRYIQSDKIPSNDGKMNYNFAAMGTAASPVERPTTPVEGPLYRPSHARRNASCESVSTTNGRVRDGFFLGKQDVRNRPIVGSRKLVIVGDGGVGKTSLLLVFSDTKFPEVYVPTVFNNTEVKLEVDGKIMSLALFDTAGQECYDRLRPLSYPETDVFLIAFSIDSDQSLESVVKQWAPELDHYCEGLPTVLVGMKKDLRGDAPTIAQLRAKRRQPVSQEQGKKTAEAIGAFMYMECSAKNFDGVDEVFKVAAALALDPKLGKKKSRKKDKCVLL
ncbi:ras-domain-containing protein [Lentithecium fluviatile CBS 122367]|uniref:Ras-domain-containing protein n=1 Tax=Lentithecium fluviatile CBS 122367 TaxID=1168545 RepID=A0A6G1JJI8_9PLEO|nr:ras-domain-containing protein [Lentithecium fluviatile CBS 122367]